MNVILCFVCNPNNYFYSGHENTFVKRIHLQCCNQQSKRLFDCFAPIYGYFKSFINKIGHSYKNNFGNTKILNAKDIEKALFNDENYIENNRLCFGTHDNVNVFGLSEMEIFYQSQRYSDRHTVKGIKEHKTNGLTVESNLKQTELTNKRCSASYDSFIGKVQSAVLRLNFCTEKSATTQSRKTLENMPK